MLTYRALESNSDAIACEVASLLAGIPVHFTTHDSASRCDVAVDRPGVKVVILPLGSTAVSDFAAWRSDMQTMAEMVAQSASACSGTVAAETGENSKGTPPQVSHTMGAEGGVFGLMPQAGAVSAVSQLVGLFASGRSVSPVGGTIEDQALIDDVGLDLRVLDVNVLSPSLYVPGALAPIDASHSPFLQELNSLLKVRA
ncbi:MAG: hypothetical protein ACRD27_04240, partial [Terracidiphilus sp.]